MRRYASASSQLAYWKDGDLRILNYLSGTAFSTNPPTLEVLQFFLTPRTLRDALLKFEAYSPESVAEAILKLIEAALVLEVDSPEWHRDRLLESWTPWLPGGAFHFLTKDAVYFGGDWTDEEKIECLPKTPPPPQFKRIPGARLIPLTKPARRKDTFFDTLYARRTHRVFAKGKVPRKKVEELLHATWGVQQYLDATFFGKLPGKTSPSGGARHPIECYLVALRVEGLGAGVYHYRADDHCLEKMGGPAAPHVARAYCADQPFVADAAVLFIMTAVFERTRWKYPHPRAYRFVLLDAGHLGQTFCLTATRLGLAPFCTAALKDSLIEKNLGLDGVSESVLYVLGAGLPAKR